jgi:hypothetical protein
LAPFLYAKLGGVVTLNLTCTSSYTFLSGPLLSLLVFVAMGDVNTLVITPTVHWKRKLKVSEDEIVWPPTMIIENTGLAKNKDGRWTGIGNVEMAQILVVLQSSPSYITAESRPLNVWIFNIETDFVHLASNLK